VRGLAVVRVQHPQAADKDGHLGRGQAQQLGLVDQKLFRRQGVTGLLVVAEAIANWLQRREGGRVGLCGRGIHPAGSERDLDGVDACSIAAAPPRTIRSARETCLSPVARALNAACTPSRARSTLASRAGWLASQSLCGARRSGAPLAPPRLSEPRKVDAEAQAVKTSSPRLERSAGSRSCGRRCP